MIYALTDRLVEKMEGKPFHSIPRVDPGVVFYCCLILFIILAKISVSEIEALSGWVLLIFFISGAWIFFRNTRRVIHIYKTSLYLKSRIYELFTYRKIIFKEHYWRVYTGHEEFYEFSWHEFSGYYIRDKTLFLVQKELNFILKFNQEKTGKETFNYLLNETFINLEKV